MKGSFVATLLTLSASIPQYGNPLYSNGGVPLPTASVQYVQRTQSVVAENNSRYIAPTPIAGPYPNYTPELASGAPCTVETPIPIPTGSASYLQPTQSVVPTSQVQPPVLYPTQSVVPTSLVQTPTGYPTQSVVPTSPVQPPVLYPTQPIGPPHPPVWYPTQSVVPTSQVQPPPAGYPTQSVVPTNEVRKKKCKRHAKNHAPTATALPTNDTKPSNYYNGPAQQDVLPTAIYKAPTAY